MPEPLAAVLAEVRALLLDPALTRAVAAGRRRGSTPPVSRAELRPVTLKAGPHLQIVTDDGTRPFTRNAAYGPDAEAAVDALLAEPFGNWHVESATATVQVRVTKKGDAQVHRAKHATAPATRATASGTHATAQVSHATAQASHATAQATVPPAGAHDRVKQWLLDPGDPLFRVVGGTAAKRRQVDAFLRSLAATLPADPAEWPNPLRVVDLGCGNAYLTFAAYRFLVERSAQAEPRSTRNTGSAQAEPRSTHDAGTAQAEPRDAGTARAEGEPRVRVIGVDVREDQRIRNSAVAAELGCADDVTFVAGTIEDAEVDVHPDLVLALHACDTATDQALARAVQWDARWVLAAPCCHHDIAAQLKSHPAPEPYAEVTRSPILRERLADVLTDSLRAALLRTRGYRVDVVEFVDSAHTPRNLLLRAHRTGTQAPRADYEALTTQWGITPALEKLLS